MSAPRRIVLVVLAAALALAAPRAGRASEADVFEHKIQPVSGQLYTKAGRFELTPTANLSVNDPFFNKYLFGAKLGYHLSDTWSVHAAFSTGSSSPTASTTLCSAKPPCQPADAAQLDQLPGRIKAMGGLEVGFSPIYGKLNLFGEQVVHFDLSLLAGADWISHEEALGAAGAALAVSQGQAPPTASSFGGHVGVGTRIFLGGMVALRLELKDYLYNARIGNPEPHDQLQRQLMAELGLSFFFPSTHSR